MEAYKIAASALLEEYAALEELIEGVYEAMESERDPVRVDRAEMAAEKLEAALVALDYAHYILEKNCDEE